MRFTALPPARGFGEKQLSVLGFGCAALMGRAGRAESLRALTAALDAGINFFDTARSYGYGAAEGLLGQFLGGGAARREDVVIATRFGILPVPRPWKQAVKPIARAAVRLVPSLRQAAQRQAANQLRGGQFSISTLRHSFEQSLRELHTEYVDMLLMHEPPPAALAKDDLLEALGRLVDEGKVRMAGLSGDFGLVEPLLDAPRQPLSVAEVPVNLQNVGTIQPIVATRKLLLVASHPFGGFETVAGARGRIAVLTGSGELGPGLSGKLKEDDSSLLPELVFGAILSGTGIAAVVPAMVKPAHIAANVQAVEHCRFSAEELAAVRSALAVGTGRPELAMAS